MRAPLSRAGLLIFALAQSAGCVQTPSVLPTAGLAQRIAPLGPEAESAGRASGSASASSPEAAERRPSTPASGKREPSPLPGIAAGREPPLTLDEAKQLALRLNPQLAAARAAVAAAQGNEEVAFSGYLPTFAANSGYQAFSSRVGGLSDGPKGRLINLPVRGFGPGVQDFTVTDLQMKWVVWEFGRQCAQHGQSLLKLQMAKLQCERARQTMEFDVSQAYYQVLQTSEALRIAEQAGKRAEAFLKDARELMRRGELSLEDTLRAEAQAKEVKQQIDDAHNQAELAVVTLNRAIGLNVNAPTRVVDRREAPPAFELSLKDCLQLAVEQRPEFLIVQKAILASETDVTIARADFLPVVTIQSTYSNVTGTRVENANVGTGGIFLNYDLYTGGKRKGRLETAHAEVRAACAQAQQICDGIAYEVHVAYRGASETHDRIGVAQAAVAQARENVRLINERYRKGEAKPPDVIDAQTVLRQAEQTLNASYQECRTALARLEYAVGSPITSTNVPVPTAAPANAVAPVVLPQPLPYNLSPYALPGTLAPLGPLPSVSPPGAARVRPPFAPPGLGLPGPGQPATPTNIAPSPLTVPPIP